jgi:hypothetical protein
MNAIQRYILNQILTVWLWSKYVYTYLYVDKLKIVNK